MKRFKKLLLGLVTFAAMVVLCAVCAGAEEYTLGLGAKVYTSGLGEKEYTSGFWKYIPRYDGTVKLTGYAGSATRIIIPATIDGLSVTSIEACAFSDNTDLVSVTIPDSVTYIERWAFQYCTSLTSVTIPDSVTSIGHGAFYDCRSLTSVSIPASVTSIGSSAFGYYNANKEDKWSPETKKIPGFTIEYAKNSHGHFYAAQNGFTTEACWLNEENYDGTVNITGYAGSDTILNIPSALDGKKVTGIGSKAFSGCTGLTSITIPDSVTSIGYSAFSDTPLFKEQTTTVKYVGKWAVDCDDKAESAVIKSGTVGIADSAFSLCTNLKSITIPDSVKNIGSSAFYYCYKLTTITIPDSVTSIGDSAFCECQGLESITIPDGVTSIGDRVFSDCTCLRSITIPDSVTSIGDRAFFCSSLSSITTIPDGVTSIGNEAFWGCDFTSITIPGSVTSIGDEAFSYCSSLTSITISDGVTSIGDSAFFNCSSLTSITIPDSVTSIGIDAFNETPLLNEQQTMTVKYVGKWAVDCADDCSSVSIKGGTVGIADSAFSDCSFLSVITIPGSVTSIGNYSLGYTFNYDSLKYEKKQGLLIYCYTGTAGETYAKENGFVYALKDHTHSYGAWTTTEAATCTATGTQTRKCSCGAYETKTVSALGHSYSAKVVAPTCTEQGYTLHTCSRCSTSYKDTNTSAKGHNYVASVVSPTYTAEGYTLHKCSRCGNSYKDTYTAKLVVPTVSGLKCSSKTNVAVTLQWTKNSVADGYILDRYDSANSKWVTVKKITSNATTSYKVTGLRASTTNRFRIKAYKSTASSKFTYLNVNTRPYTTTGLSVSSKTNVAITLKWNKNISADGYVLDKYDGTKWVTVKKITSNATTSYTVTGLKASTTFKFRLKAYKMYGTAYESSAFSYINVNTRPYTTTGFKISSTTKTSITMRWNKNISASGYCIEKWDGSKWVQIKRFTSNANVSYTVVSGLKANTSYKFRMRAYKTIGTVNEYSAYTQTLTAKTKA